MDTYAGDVQSSELTNDAGGSSFGLVAPAHPGDGLRVDLIAVVDGVTDTPDKQGAAA